MSMARSGTWTACSRRSGELDGVKVGRGRALGLRSGATKGERVTEDMRKEEKKEEDRGDEPAVYIYIST